MLKEGQSLLSCVSPGFHCLTLSLFSLHQGHFHHIQSRLQQLKSQAGTHDGMACHIPADTHDGLTYQEQQVPMVEWHTENITDLDGMAYIPRTSCTSMEWRNIWTAGALMEWCTEDQEVQNLAYCWAFVCVQHISMISNKAFRLISFKVVFVISPSVTFYLLSRLSVGTLPRKNSESECVQMFMLEMYRECTSWFCSCAKCFSKAVLSQSVGERGR